MSKPQPVLFVGGPEDDKLMMVQPRIWETGVVKIPVSDGGSINYVIVRDRNFAVPDTWRRLSVFAIIDLRDNCATHVADDMLSKLVRAGADERTAYTTFSPIYDGYFVEVLATGFAE